MSQYRYFYAPGMHYPYWIVTEVPDWPKPGVTTSVANNAEADTDMGMMSEAEFHEMLPGAYEVSEQQYRDWVAGL